MARHARLQICTSFIRIAKTAGKSLLPHMKVNCIFIFHSNCLLQKIENWSFLLWVRVTHIYIYTYSGDGLHRNHKSFLNMSNVSYTLD